METKMLTASDLEAINAKYGLDLDYANATHYRAAQVIWTISRSTTRGQEDDPSAGTPAKDPVPSGTSVSCPSSNADTDD